MLNPNGCSAKGTFFVSHKYTNYSAVQEFHRKVPILGICLGHQAIGQYFGGEVVKAKRQLHGKSSQIITNKKGIFKGVS